jgi:hypothetical protein
VAVVKRPLRNENNKSSRMYRASERREKISKPEAELRREAQKEKIESYTREKANHSVWLGQRIVVDVVL